MFHTSSENPYSFDVNYEEYEEQVTKASFDRPILVDLWADWCGPCVVISPMLDKIVRHYEGRILLAKVEVDEGENMKIAGHNKVRGFPTILLIQNGEEKGRFSGARPLHAIDEFIQQHAEL